MTISLTASWVPTQTRETVGLIGPATAIAKEGFGNGITVQNACEGPDPIIVAPE